MYQTQFITWWGTRRSNAVTCQVTSSQKYLQSSLSNFHTSQVSDAFVRFEDIPQGVSRQLIFFFFVFFTDLNLSNNQMSKLPDELSDLEKLERLDISHNSYIALPNVVFRIPQLKYLNAQHNHILGRLFFFERHTKFAQITWIIYCVECRRPLTLCFGCVPLRLCFSEF